MLELIPRSPKYVDGYRAYCREAFEGHVTYFVPSDPDKIDPGWFERTKWWYDKKEKGLIPGVPAGFHYWAVDGEDFIGEFQLRTESSHDVLYGIGNIGYAVRVSRQHRGFGTAILQKGLLIAKDHGMSSVILNINDENVVSSHVCEKLGGVLVDKIRAVNEAEGDHLMRRYRIIL